MTYPGTHSAADIRVYLDGEAQPRESESDNLLGADTNNSASLTLGGEESGANNMFAGELDEVRFWGEARSAEQIAGGMSSPLAGDEPGLLAYYDFDEGVAGGNNAGVTTLPGRTVGAPNGTLQGFSLAGDSSNWVTSGAYARDEEH